MQGTFPDKKKASENHSRLTQTSVIVQMAREKINATHSANNKPTPRSCECARFSSHATKIEYRGSFLSDRNKAHQHETKNYQSSQLRPLSDPNQYTFAAFVENRRSQKCSTAKTDTHMLLPPRHARHQAVLGFSPFSLLAQPHLLLFLTILVTMFNHARLIIQLN